VIIFCSVFTYKNNHQLKKTTETGSNRLVLIRYGYFTKKKPANTCTVFWVVFGLSDGLVIDVNIV
jgi:hypothetical protein